MTFLVVDNNHDRLQRTVSELKQISPENNIEYTHDPLTAVQFAAVKRVDIMLCARDMEPMDGTQLKESVHLIQPRTKTVLFSYR